MLALTLNSILWPLFHYHPGEISFNEDDWGAYQQANNLFAKAINEIVRDGDLVWVQDYHLMLLPKLLREEIVNQREKDEPIKNIKIGFFLHTPFPSSEVYRYVMSMTTSTLTAGAFFFGQVTRVIHIDFLLM